MQDENGEETFLISQVHGTQLFGTRYNQSEQGNETQELDSTVKYRKVECPDLKRPAAIED